MRVNADKDAQDDEGEIILKSRTNVMIFKVTIFSVEFLFRFRFRSICYTILDLVWLDKQVFSNIHKFKIINKNSFTLFSFLFFFLENIAKLLVQTTSPFLFLFFYVSIF